MYYGGLFDDVLYLILILVGDIGGGILLLVIGIILVFLYV